MKGVIIMTLGERIKSVRKAAKQTQKDFSAALGVSSNYIYLIESGKEKPSDRTLNDICRIYDVNKEWLESEIGVPYVERSQEEIIAKFFGEIVGLEEDNFTKRFIKLLASMDAEQRTAFDKFGQMIIDSRNDKQMPKESG